MKDKIDEFAVAGTAAVTDITPKILSTAIEEIARDNKVWAQFYKVNRDLMTSGGTEVVFPMKGAGVTASWGLTQGQGLTASGMTFSGKTIAVSKGGVGLGLYGEAVRQTQRDVISDNINEAGLVWADTIDTAAFEAMFPTATATACNGGTFVAGSVGIMGVKSVSPSTCTGFTIVNLGTSSSIAYASSAVGTVTYWYCPTTAAYDNVGSGASSLVLRDVNTLKNAIVGYKFKPKVLIGHPERVTDIIFDTTAKFLEKSAYEGVGPVYTGEIGMVLGLKVISCVYAPTIALIAIDDARLGYQVIRKELDMQRDQYTGMSLDALYFWGFAEKGFGVVNARSYGAVAVKGTYAITAGLGSGYP
jgi:hypothetical protein